MTTLLEVQGLGITFGGLKAVNDVSFSVRPGEIVSVIGLVFVLVVRFFPRGVLGMLRSGARA